MDSSVSIIPKTLSEANIRSDALQAPAISLETYSCSPVPVLGCLNIIVSRNDVSYFTKLLIVESGTTLLEMDPIKGLQLCFNGTTVVDARQSTTAPVMHLSNTPPMQST